MISKPMVLKQCAYGLTVCTGFESIETDKLIPCEKDARADWHGWHLCAEHYDLVAQREKENALNA